MSEELNYPNVAAVRDQARRAWEKQARKNIAIQERIGESISWWIVVVALVFFALSAPHTATVFAMLTPWFGYVAPIGVELGQLFTAFRRKYSKSQGQRVPKSNWALEILLFTTAIIVNGAGSFAAVVETSDKTQNKSMAELMSQYGSLPATSQVALFLVPIAALIIPIGAAVAGESLASLFLERKARGGGLLDERWRDVSAEIEFLALRDAAIGRGIAPKDAARWAYQITGYGSSIGQAKRKDSEHQQASTGRPVDRESERQAVIVNASSGYTKRMDARSVIRDYLTRHPEMRGSLNEIVDAIYNETGVKVGRSSVHNVLQESPTEHPEFGSNGHHGN